MSRFHSYLNSTVHILEQYQGNEPFSLFIKRFFSRNKKYGSRDRWLISDFCFYYFRLGKALTDLPVEERILIGIFLCSTKPNRMLETHKPEWNERAEADLKTKCTIIGIEHDQLLNDIFPMTDDLSEGMDHQSFAASYFTKPDVFLRLRSSGIASVKHKLKSAHIPATQISEKTIAVPAGAKADRELNIDSEVVIQDLSSQKVEEFFPELEHPSIWDCCAASGGKSIMAMDHYEKAELTVSDVRENILHNLDKRFESAGIKEYSKLVADLTKPVSELEGRQFDLIIADVPCSGSGTWGRTPEQLFYFEESGIERYATLQKDIVSNVIPQLKAGGYLLYITCSVFKQENEEAVEFIKSEYGLETEQLELIKGYDKRADTMFACLFSKQ